jgi:predicted MFS family arabinose efflux permease
VRGPVGVIVALTLGRIAFGFQVQTVASLGPSLADAFHFDFATLGTLIGLYMAPGAVVALPYGFIGRRFGERDTVAVGMTLMVLGSALAALASGTVMIGAGRVVSGAGAVGLTVLHGKMLSDRFHGSRFTLLMGLTVGAFPIGIGLAQVITPRLAAVYGWPAGFWAGAVLAAVTGVVFVLTWDRPRPAAVARSMAWPSRPEVRLILAASLIWTAYNAAYFNFMGYMPSLLAARGHGQAVADAVLSLATWGNLPAILLGGAIAVRFGPTRVFMTATLLCALTVAGPALVDVPMIWAALFGTVASMHGGLIVELGTLSAKPDNRAVGMGLFYTAYYLGGAVLPAICGAAADAVGDPSGALFCAAAISLLAVPFFLLHRHWLRAGV